MKEMANTIEDMHMSINEKEAEIIRLNMCLCDEKKRNSELKSYGKGESTPKRQ